MIKIVFMGAGSTAFAKNILGDCFLTDSLRDSTFALYDIDAERLHESWMMLENLNANINEGKATITKHLGVKQRKTALKDADFIINAIQVGGYDPSTIADMEIPKKYGLHQTIGDTLGIGGIFRGLRTIHVVEGFANDIKSVCPNAWLLNYTNPMAIISGYLQKICQINCVGLCHSVQICTDSLLKDLGLFEKYNPVKTKIAGLNHMAWLLEISHDGKSIYPEIRKLAEKKNVNAKKKGAEKHPDMVRYELMKHFGYFVTGSTTHSAEYYPYFIKSNAPELVDDLDIKLDWCLTACKKNITNWQEQREELIHNKSLTHQHSIEYASQIMEAMVTNTPTEVAGNVLNHGFIPNLPSDACVEIPCLVNQNGIAGTYVGALPTQLAALNMTHINVHSLVTEAAQKRSRSMVYQAAMLDPHTSAELPLDKIKDMCDDLFEQHIRDGILPEYK